MQERNRQNPHRYSVYQSRYNNITKIYQTQIASIKTLSLHHLTAKQHMLLALCRDISLIPAGFHMCKSIRKAYLISFKDIFHNKYTETNTNNEIKILSNLITGRASEYMLCSMWCLVSLYLSFATLDNLMVRWIMKYSIMAVILRMFSMSLVLITIEHFLLNSLSPERDYYLHTWILISGILTGLFIWQNYLNSNLDYLNNRRDASRIDTDPHSDNDEMSHSISVPAEETESHQPNTDPRLKRAFNLYNIIVFCVVPLGMASFVTMLCLLRNLFIQRLDIEHLIDLLAIQV